MTSTPGAVEREAARILLRMINRINVVNVTNAMARIDADIPLSVLDQLCVWGSPFLEPEPWEDDGDCEDDRAA
jgi:hypothetical protein